MPKTTEPLEIILTRGLPGSGKSYWAKKQVLASSGRIKRINKDDLRAMLDGAVWSKPNEKFILKMRDYMTEQALLDGKSVIIDDTNFVPKHFERMNEIAHAFRREVTVRYQDFTDVPIHVCIARDLERPNSVGEKVIRKMAREHLSGVPVTAPVFNPKLPSCVIIDLDGTTALNDGHRGWFEYHKVIDDKPNQKVIDVITTYIRNSKRLVYPVFVSGREASCYDVTKEWIKKYCGMMLFGDVVTLHMRPIGNFECDSVVKHDLYNAHIVGSYNVDCVFDDRTRVVDMWRSLGLQVFQVANGDF